jgi:hypothetical protein
MRILRPLPGMIVIVRMAAVTLGIVPAVASPQRGRSAKSVPDRESQWRAILQVPFAAPR